MNKWYYMCTSSNIDRFLSVFQGKKEIIPHVVVPIHNDNHVFMLDVFLLSHKRPNGQVTLYDYLDSVEKAKNLSAKMWWTKYFGIYHQSNNLVVG